PHTAGYSAAAGDPFTLPPLRRLLAGSNKEPNTQTPKGAEPQLQGLAWGGGRAFGMAAANSVAWLGHPAEEGTKAGAEGGMWAEGLGLWAAMEAEHGGEDAQRHFKTCRWGPSGECYQSRALDEWLFATVKEEDWPSHLHGQHTRLHVLPKEVRRRKEAARALLTIEEVAALRLATGPMREVYNLVLRSHTSSNVPSVGNPCTPNPKPCTL
ncbi:hypothetical protein T484DRAFT_3634733, partial [Baffinella frigidus]